MVTVGCLVVAFAAAPEPVSGGVVVERVGPGSILDLAGLKTEDRILAWRRLGDPATGATELGGDVETAFDWYRLRVEEAPRGRILLLGRRAEVELALEVDLGLWDATVRPDLSPEDLRPYHGLLKCWFDLRTAENSASAGDFERSLEAYRSALTEASTAVARAAVLESFGDAHLRRKSFDEAREAYVGALESWRSRGAPNLGEAGAREKLSALSRHRGEYGEALEHLEQALAIRHELAPDSVELANTLNLLGHDAGVRGDLERAEASFRRALALHEKLRAPSLVLATSLSHLGTAILYRRGDLDQAEAYFERARRLNEQLAPGSLAVAKSLSNLAAIVGERGQHELAVKYLERALEIEQRQKPDSPAAASTLNNLGVASELLGDLTAARSYFERALQIVQEKQPGNVGHVTFLQNLGDVSAAQGDLSAASDYYERALELGERQAPETSQVAKIWHSLGTVARRTGALDKADRCLRRALDILELQVGKVGGSQDLRAGFRSQFISYYRDYVELLLQLERPEQAFSVLERSRAQGLLAMLAERDLATGRVPVDLEEARRQLAMDYDRVQHRLSGLDAERDPMQVKALRSQLRRLREEREDVLERIRRASPELASLRYPQPLDGRQARDVLAPSTVMLSYSVGRRRTDVFVLSAGQQLRVETLPISEEELRERVELFRRTIRQYRPGSIFAARGLASPTEVGEQLYRQLVEPFAEEVAEARRILFIPDGPLHSLPWGALVVPAEGEASGQYLVESKPIHLALSATVYAELKRSRASRLTRDLVVFGDPLYPRLRAADDVRQSAEEALRSVLERGFEFDPLPESRREAQRIAEIYSGSAAVHLGKDATEEHVKLLAPGARYVHFATHSTLDERFPLDSAVVLTLYQEHVEGRDNGLLQAWEIFEEVRLDAELVVLSSCQSALGQELNGEGLIGLTRAFHYAGARSVAASLWPVADAATQELMVRFHRHLEAGLDRDEALRAAQVELIRGPVRLGGKGAELDASAPFYWAAFQVYGDVQ